MIKEADIILSRIPTSNLELKRRPALVLRIIPGYNDLLICGISSKLNQYIPDLDCLILQNSNDFTTSGLKEQSIIRTAYVSVMPLNLIEGKLGKISTESYLNVISNLYRFIKGNC